MKSTALFFFSFNWEIRFEWLEAREEYIMTEYKDEHFTSKNIDHVQEYIRDEFTWKKAVGYICIYHVYVFFLN